ncbi:hypothetical protein QE361_002719 [Sphingomonas sp. SORGH_AS802]|uniref:hypothetical protein n=1 Tax=Sphingomonas sp. SORGH_AS_0802 TaxID=3041800 RepID=UPI0028636C3D|nr:hypothetical protein [Sphingomonas sp. SORGH_AS_0802]MDR6135724.1 hypothetical protein [Sphingomonas sp. SORGH_AS_0802]
MSSSEEGGVAPGIAPLDPISVANECEQAIPHTKAGQFYGPVGSLSFGAGVIVENLAYPVYVPNAGAYGTRLGTALVLSHECDIDPDNIRPFNSNVLVAPIIKLGDYISQAAATYSHIETKSFLLNVASGKTTRLFFLPRFGSSTSSLYQGGLIDLNFLASCGVGALVKSTKVCALSGFALTTLDIAIQNHLIRQKSEKPPMPR